MILRIKIVCQKRRMNFDMSHKCIGNSATDKQTVYKIISLALLTYNLQISVTPIWTTL